MMEERQTAGDIVFGAALQIAQDMIDATQASIKDLVTYGQIFKSMASGLDSIKINLKEHITLNKWASKTDKERMRIKLRQIDSLSKVCMAYAKVFERASLSIVKVTENMEKKPILEEILTDLEMDPGDWED